MVGKTLTRGGTSGFVRDRVYSITASLLLTKDEASYAGISPRLPLDLAQVQGVL